MPKEQPIEEWVSDITISHNNHAKAIEVLELRERSLKEISEMHEAEIITLRGAINLLMDKLDITLEG
jgi:hypothetical protein